MTPDSRQADRLTTDNEHLTSSDGPSTMRPMHPVVLADSLSKMYRLYAGRGAVLRELVLRRRSHDELWALKDLSFQIGNGEAFGLIGNNGAGKSTLLKILCGTSFATRGRLRVHGTVGSLLELGAGFHPDFTGRENIYFNGALMGFDRTRIGRRENEIIEFSELGDFIDRPVKTYSSGMYVRLGFAVATGFRPDILVIDEALAVGDQGFQKKCTDRIMNYQEAGTTILFCSHNLYQVRKLCDRTLWLDGGQMVALGPSDDVVDRYQDGDLNPSTRTDGPVSPAAVEGSPICRIERWRLTGSDGEPRNRFRSGETVRLETWSSFDKSFRETPGVGVSIVRNDGTMVYTTSSTMDGFELEQRNDGTWYACLVFPELPLLAGSYSFTLMATDRFNMQVYDAREDVEPFIINHPGPDFGVTSLEHRWESLASDMKAADPANSDSNA